MTAVRVIGHALAAGLMVGAAISSAPEYMPVFAGLVGINVGGAVLSAIDYAKGPKL